MHAVLGLLPHHAGRAVEHAGAVAELVSDGAEISVRHRIGDADTKKLLPAWTKQNANGTVRTSEFVALAEKDGYTEEHTRRVALRAVQVGFFEMLVDQVVKEQSAEFAKTGK